MVNTLYRTKLVLVVEIIFFIFVPLVLSMINHEFYRLRGFLLIASIIYVVFISKVLGITMNHLGATREHVVNACRGLLFPTIIASLFVGGVFQIFPRILFVDTFSWAVDAPTKIYKLLLYVCVSVPLQELVFRGYMISRLEYVSRNKTFLLICPSMLFMLVHLPFGNFMFSLSTFLIGLLWTRNFLVYRNLYAVILSHMVVGAVFLYFIL